MDVFDAIERRRSVKKWTDRPVPRETIERLLELAVLAPNHGMTEPWEFCVLGDEAKRAYAEARARRKSKRVDAADVADAIREKVLRKTLRVPALLAITMRIDEDPETREEDYAATFMAIQNLSLGATALGLGTKIHTGRILEDGDLRRALEVPDDHRIVAIVDLGEPKSVPDPKPRTPASRKTRWLS